jgi:hypothetical protein
MGPPVRRLDIEYVKRPCLGRLGMKSMRFIIHTVACRRDSRRCRVHAQGDSRPGDRRAAEAKSTGIGTRLKEMKLKRGAARRAEGMRDANAPLMLTAAHRID